MTRELIFEVTEAEEGGFNAKALGQSIFTQADTWEELKLKLREAVDCHYDSEDEKPQIIRIHFVKDEAIAV